METGMKTSTQQQQQAERVATQTFDRFPDWLNKETEDGKYKILAQLLSDELEQIKQRSKR
jgi:hypothetical protein